MSGIDFSQIPSAAPPPGVIPNFIDPPSQADIPRIITYVTLPPMLLFLALRNYTRIFITGKLGLDDYLSLLAAISNIIYIGLLFSTLDNPAGPHLWDVPVSKLSVWYIKVSVVTGLLMMAASIFVKTSILALYRRIFSPARQSNLIILGGMGFILAFYTSMIIALAVGCTPRSQDYVPGPLGTAFTGWKSTTYSARCNKFNPGITAALGVVGAAVDLYILVIPLLFISELHISSKRKIGLAAIFTVGASAFIFSVIAAYFRFEIIETSAEDQTWATMPVDGWSIAEINMGILCSCIPVAFVVFKGAAQKSSSWASHIWSNLTGGYLKGSAPNGVSEGEIKVMPYREVTNDQNLPLVPKATMTGLRSFLGRVGRTKTGTSDPDTVASDDLNLTAVSRDYDYHRQLRAGSMDKRPYPHYRS